MDQRGKEKNENSRVPQKRLPRPTQRGRGRTSCRGDQGEGGGAAGRVQRVRKRASFVVKAFKNRLLQAKETFSRRPPRTHNEEAS